MKQKALHFLAVAVVVPAVLGLGVWSAREAYAACTIHFDNAIDDWDTNSIGSFGTLQTPKPDVRVDYNSTGGEAPWTLVVSETPGNSVNLATQSVTPRSFEITQDGMGDVAATITGSLENVDMDGLYQLSAWQDTTIGCSGAHDITINHP